MRFMLSLLATMIVATSASAAPKSYRLPSTDLKKPVIWGAVCDGPHGTGLAFGGQDQKSDDGRGHTQIKTKDGWQAIYKDLQQPHRRLHKYAGVVNGLATLLRQRAAAARSIYLAGHTRGELARALATGPFTVPRSRAFS